MFGGSPFGASYFGQGPVRSTPLAVLLVEFATVRSLSPVRTVDGSVAHVVRSLSLVRTVDGTVDHVVRSLTVARNVEGIP